MDIYYKPILMDAFLFLLITVNIAKRIYFSHWHVAYAQFLKRLKQKMTQLENLIMNLSKYHYPKQLTESGKRQASDLKEILTKSEF